MKINTHLSILLIFLINLTISEFINIDELLNKSKNVCLLCGVSQPWRKKAPSDEFWIWLADQTEETDFMPTYHLTSLCPNKVVFSNPSGWMPATAKEGFYATSTWVGSNCHSIFVRIERDNETLSIVLDHVANIERGLLVHDDLLSDKAQWVRGDQNR